MPPETSISKRVEPSIHSSTLDSFRIVNKQPPKSEEHAAELMAERHGDGQPIRTQARTVTIGQRAPIQVTMGGSGATVVHRPPPTGPGDVPRQPYATGPVVGMVAPIMQPGGIERVLNRAPVTVIPALSAEQIALCIVLAERELERLEISEGPADEVTLAKATLAALEAIR